jgi:hypothetical protein
MGARFDACMHAIPGITDITTNIWPCLNNTANPSTDGPLCSLSEICGFGGFHGQTPDQVISLKSWLILVVSNHCTYIPTCWSITYSFQFVGTITFRSRYGKSNRNNPIHVNLFPIWNNGIHPRCQFRWKWSCKYRMFRFPFWNNRNSPTCTIPPH